MILDGQTVADFALLFRGGKVAIDSPDDDRGFRPWQTDSGGFIPADGKDWINVVDNHLNTGPSVGVYPLFVHDDVHKVYWGCVDWDSGPEESWTHAKNVWEVLRQLGVRSWVEQSRSKGFHVWVFFQDAMPAVDVREGLLGACAVVEAPAKEVNPKQVELSERGWGNGMRLPYGRLRRPGGGQEMKDPSVTFSMMPVTIFVPKALAHRTAAETWEAVRAIYSPPEAFPLPPVGDPPSGPMKGLAGHVRRYGPRPTVDKPQGDRSATLFNLACAMTRQGYDQRAIIRELEDADTEWGGKYTDRPDGDRILWKMVTDAQAKAGRPQPTPNL